MGNRSGQAIIEYLLLLLIVIGLMTILNSGLRGSIYQLWGFLKDEIATPCPGCQ